MIAYHTTLVSAFEVRKRRILYVKCFYALRNNIEACTRDRKNRVIKLTAGTEGKNSFQS